jgi:ABC-type multidrug transport system fused ATPase/permease subunit
LIGLLLLFPVLILAFLVLRQPGTIARMEAIFECQRELVRYIQQTTLCQRLIADYGKKHSTIQTFAEKTATFNKAATRELIWSAENSHFAPFITLVVIAAYIFLGHFAVIDGRGQIGMFVSQISSLQTIGCCYQDIYTNLMQMQQALNNLFKIVVYMNLPVDLGQRQKNHRWTLDEGFRKWDEAKQQNQMQPQSAFALDRVNIQCYMMTFSYSGFDGHDIQVFNGIGFDIPQGNLVTFTGPRGSGKATLLQLFGGVLFPSHGRIFVPPHLRVLHVSYQPMHIQELTLLENLKFGPTDGADKSNDRILAICKRLGVSEQICEMLNGLIEADEMKNKPPQQQKTAKTSRQTMRESVERNSRMTVNVGKLLSVPNAPGGNKSMYSVDPNELLSHTDKCLIHICRGLIMNPEMLVIHKPLSHFDANHERILIEALREYVENRGLEKSSDDREQRRPRSCIYSMDHTASWLNDPMAADLRYYVADGMIEKFATAEVTELQQRLVDALTPEDKSEEVSVKHLAAVMNREPLLANVLDIAHTKQSDDDVIIRNVSSGFIKPDIGGAIERISCAVNGAGIVDDTKMLQLEYLISLIREAFTEHLGLVLVSARACGFQFAEGTSSGGLPNGDTWNAPPIPVEQASPQANRSGMKLSERPSPSPSTVQMLPQPKAESRNPWMC